jgi:hypothetical protein
MRTLLGMLMGLALACAPQPTGSGTRRSGILGGTADPASTNVFLLDLRYDTSASICSAVLISPRVLLTAAHCVDPVYHSATALTVRATNKPDTVMLMQSDMIDVTTVSLHPSWNPGVAQSDYDLAVLLLARAPVGVTPAQLSRVAAIAGQAIRVVGYGRTSAGAASSSGTRRTVSLTISSVTATDFSFGTSGSLGICAGDSGGPSFVGAAVAGIHSGGDSSSCGRGLDIRVDRNLSFIDGFVVANDPPSCAGDGRCATGCGGTADPDCPCQADSRCDAACGITDPDCLDDGAVCTLAAQCAGGRCLDDPRGFQFCSRSCASSSECVNELTCQADVCRAPPDPAKADPVAGGCTSVPGSLAVLLVLFARRRR